MSYDEVNDDFEGNASTDTVNFDSPALENERAGIVEDEAELRSNLKAKDKGTVKSPEVRRAIEDHQDRTKLQKDLDYLFDEHFADDEEDS